MKIHLTIHFISTEEECEAAIQSLSSLKYVGFDCEGYLNLSRHGKIAVIQLSSDTDSYVFDIYGMNNQIPKCLKDFLEKKPDIHKGPIKIIHDCRADQDALFHVYGIRLNGIFDTSVAYVVRRVVAYNRFTRRLAGLMGLIERSLSYDLFEDLAVSYPILRTDSDTTKEKKTNDDVELLKKDPSDASGLTNSQDKDNKKKKWIKRRKVRVNIFNMKDNVKIKFARDPKFWGTRPMTKEMLLYAGLDSFLTLKVGKSYIEKFGKVLNQYDKTLYVSNTYWSQSLRKRQHRISGTGQVSPSLIRAVKEDLSPCKINTLYSSAQHITVSNNKNDSDQTSTVIHTVIPTAIDTVISNVIDTVISTAVAASDTVVGTTIVNTIPTATTTTISDTCLIQPIATVDITTNDLNVKIE